MHFSTKARAPVIGTYAQSAEKTSCSIPIDFAFNSLVAELNRSLHNEGLPLSHAQFAILQNLFIKEGQIQIEIVRRVGKDRAAVSRSLNTLEENGFIKRKAISGSKNGIFLTEKVIQKRKKIVNAINKAILVARVGISDEEYEKV